MLARTCLALALAFGPATAWAAASSAPFGYVPEPALRTETPAQLQSRVKRACGVTQGRIQTADARGIDRGCSCYARTVMKALDATEVAAYRTTGVFNPTARAKALGALDACKLPRPV